MHYAECPHKEGMAPWYTTDAAWLYVVSCQKPLYLFYN